MKIKLLIMLLLLVQVAAYTQEAQKAKEKIRFRSYNNIGLVQGEMHREMLIQSVNGVQKGKMFAGVGVGIDYYWLRSVPVFLEVRRSFSGKPGSAYVYASGGGNFVEKRTTDDPWNRTSTNDGFYFDAGLGYSFKIGQQDRLTLSAGYSGKSYSYALRILPDCFTGNCPEFISETKYRLHRVVVKVGVVIP
jgi:hypothetical protein